MPSLAPRLSISSSRLHDMVHSTAKWGAHTRWGPASTETGMARLTLTDSDKMVRDWLVSEAKKIGCSTKIDQMGNIFCIYPGKKEGPPTAMGSHLDTQPTGGRYDGILGVLSGFEVLRTLHENNFTPNYPIAVIDWTNEEGARFPVSMVSSGVYAGQIKLEDAYNLKAVLEPKDVTLKEDLERIGYLGSVPASFSANPIAAHFELHIEQGPILEHEKREVGIVTGVQSFAWYNVIVSGRACHAGTTPFVNRADAMLAASRMMVAINDIAVKHNGLATFGIINSMPGSVNVVPEQVTFSLDFRHPTDEAREKMDAEIRVACKDIVNANTIPLSVEFENLFISPAIHFNPDCIAAVTDAALAATGDKNKVREITSGAGHDSCYASMVCPTSMIFVPSKDGLSHNPSEYTSPEECAMGAQVLLNTVLTYDANRSE